MTAIYVAMMLLGELIGVTIVSYVVYKIIKREIIKEVNRKQRNAAKRSSSFLLKEVCYAEDN